MAGNPLNRYIWLVELVRRYGRITREDINAHWRKSPFSMGIDMPRRTFYNYRLAVEELFKIEIKCDQSTFEYYIDETDSHSESMTGWLLNAASLSNVLSDSREVSSRIFLEDVPSAREFLATIVDAIKESGVIRFDYLPYTRVNATPDVQLEPYLLKIFRQRWYVTGRNVKENKIKTYALDRMQAVTITGTKFEFPDDFDLEGYFAHSFGIVVDHSEPQQVVIRTDPRQAKYLRALPLHHTQSEMIHDAYSTFTYRIRLTPDFVQELLGYGPRITVMSPPVLRAMMVTSLQQSLANYQNPEL